jgi:aspartate/methionine/tyrosine aminotransferase
MSDRFHQMPPDIPTDLRAMIRRAERKGRSVIDLTGSSVELPDGFNPLVKRFDGDGDGVLAVSRFIAECNDSRFGVRLNPRAEVLPVADVGMLPREICLALVNPGEPVLVPDPGQSGFRLAAVMAGGVPTPYNLYERNDYLLNLESIPKETAHEARIMFLDYPHNPTGALADLAFFEELVSFAREFNIILVHDCTNGMIVFHDHSPLSLLQANGARRVALEYAGFDRPFGTRSNPAGYLAGNRELIAGIEAVLSSSSGRETGRALFEEGISSYNLSPSMGEAAAGLERKRDLALDSLRAAGWTVHRPHGSPFLWINLPPRYTSLGFVSACLRRTDVALMPGSAFGELGEGWVRMSIGVSEEMLRAGLKKLTAEAPVWPGRKTGSKRR